jgi:hypothetical protein
VRSSQKKNINHKEHKELKGREARKIKFLRPLRLSHPKGTAMAVPFFVTFVVKSLSPVRCGVAVVAIGVFPPR